MTEALETPALNGNPSSAAVNDIGAALALTQGEIQTVIKDAEGAITEKRKYKYATLDKIIEASRQIAAKNGLALLQMPKGDFLHTILLHSSGQWIDYGNYPLGRAERHQERGSAITYARRYVTQCVYNIAAEEDDDAKNGDESLSQVSESNAAPRTLLSAKAPDKLSAYNDKKAEYAVAVPVLPDGSLDYDAFGAELEIALDNASHLNDVSMLKKANAKILTSMKVDRPEMYEHLKNHFTIIGNKFA